MYHYFKNDGEELGSKKVAMTCPECGETEDIDYNLSGWQGESETKCTFREYACLCNKCETLFDFQEIKYWNED